MFAATLALTLSLASASRCASAARHTELSCEAHANHAYNGTPVAGATPLRNCTVDACCAACSADTNCAWYNWHPVGFHGQPTWCQLLGGNGTLVPTAAAENFMAGRVVTHVLCRDDMDCSLAGECVAGKCVCDGWSHGDHCEVLNLEPADPVAYGYRNASGYHSWGGASIQDPATGKWWLFLSLISGKCPLLGYWATYSEGVRLVSANPTGPWTWDAVVLPSFAHNVKPFRAPDGTWLVYYVGKRNNASHTCNNSAHAPRGSETLQTRGKQTAGPIRVASAATVDAPPDQWTVHGPLTDSDGWHSATNPSVVFDANGTAHMCVSHGWRLDSGGFAKTNLMMRAANWRGPYVNVTPGDYAETIHSGEDPDVFRTKRGWHMLNHNQGLAATKMWVSRDGVSWRPTLGESAFTASVEFTNGTKRALCWRQRPQIVFAEDGMPGWLWTGVQDGGHACTFNSSNTLQSWTLAQRIGRNHS